MEEGFVRLFTSNKSRFSRKQILKYKHIISFFKPMKSVNSVSKKNCSGREASQKFAQGGKYTYTQENKIVKLTRSIIKKK